MALLTHDIGGLSGELAENAAGGDGRQRKETPHLMSKLACLPA